MKPHDLMPSRTLRGLLLALILMTVALLAAPRNADAGLVIRAKAGPVKIISSPRAKAVVVGPSRGVTVHRPRPAGRVLVAKRVGPRTVVKCGVRKAPVQRVWVPGHWVKTGPRTSRWVPGHWKRV